MTTRQFDRFDTLLSYERDHAARVHEAAKLFAVEEAIKRLHHDPDHFGLCITCGSAIDSDRLRIVPATRFCEDHAEMRAAALR